MENLQNISCGFKNLNVNKAPISKHIEDVKRQAEDLVFNQFPWRILELDALLKTSNYITSEIVSARNKLILDPNTQRGDDDGAISQKRKLDVGFDSAPRNNYIEQVIPSNNLVIGEIELIKPRVDQLLQDIQLLKMWIQFLTPRSEDVNDFIKSVFDGILSEIQAVEGSAKEFSDQIFCHFLSRGKIIAKVMKYPLLEDYRRAVEEMDENFRRIIKQTLCDIRNDYSTLYDMILKNFARIKYLRNFDPRAMY